MDDKVSLPGAEEAIAHITQLLNNPLPPDMTPELAELAGLAALHDSMLALRTHLSQISRGDLSQDVRFRGYAAGLLKSHLAHLRHLTWQVKQVEQGDFTQRVDFMGSFSDAFNAMVVQLDTTLTSLTSTQAALTQLTDSLRYEVKERTSAVNSLKESEAKFKYLADHDPLTGAMNRRSFLHLAENGIKSAFSRRAFCCIALLDIDHFKRFNDTYGHLGGDTTLKHVVQLSQANLRQSDTMGRFGGEEFVFFFADTDAHQGIKAAERIRSAIETTPVELDEGIAPLTASLGVCVINPNRPEPRNGFFLQEAIAKADEALYQAKQEGRNRVCLAAEEVPGETPKAEAPPQDAPEKS